MKRAAGFALVLVPIVFVLMAAGYGKKAEALQAAAKPAPPPSVNMKEGNWEITTTFEMPGMPAGTMKPRSFTTCLSQKDYLPTDKDQKNCTMQDVKIKGNTVTWSMVCKDSSSNGWVTYAGSTFDGVIETITREGGKETNVRMAMKGKHLGPCPK